MTAPSEPTTAAIVAELRRLEAMRTEPKMSVRRYAAAACSRPWGKWADRIEAEAQADLRTAANRLITALDEVIAEQPPFYLPIRAMGALRDLRALAGTAQASPAGPPCTGKEARWCPVHGDCTCGPYDNTGDSTLNDPGCPLHDPNESEHASPASPERDVTDAYFMGAKPGHTHRTISHVHDGLGHEHPQASPERDAACESTPLDEAAQDALTEMARFLYSDDGPNRTRMEMAHDDLRDALDAAAATPAPAASEPDALRAAAESVLDWADEMKPWNPSGAFAGLYEATGRRPPQGGEPTGPRYYRFAATPAPAASGPEVLQVVRVVQPYLDAGYDLDYIRDALEEATRE